MRGRHVTWLAVIVLALLFVFVNSGLDFAYVIPKRLARLAAMVIGGVCVACSAIAFQTLSGNRILTPAIMGYEAVYLLLHALLVLAMGVQGLLILGNDGNFLLSLLVLLGYSWALHRWLFRGASSNVFFLLLVGLVLTMVMATLTQFVQLKVSPGEFSMLQGYSQASFNRASPRLLLASAVLVAVLCTLLARTAPVLDVLALGRDQAISLGVDYRRSMHLQLAIIAALVTVSTSLLGPTAFMGVFVANITYAVAGTFRHRVTLALGSGVAIGVFISAQMLVEHVFNYKTTVGILVNLVCGTYFLMLMVRTRGAA
ncbi:MULTISPECIES: iron chelate uptake ABC transporter family permease subunit [Pseudomonas]|uniref:Iron complex transport system permease protein n=1 Tax=Pseudomonas hunanensis TaxID=1247546 RepID=A0ACC6JZH4_9PSED|nr:MULTISPECIES: iron chelate uptake ABC transporter family permease subunit [Pseudomonas]MBP2261755.1 iron complex transport system permease protein [Pseudomonas sp. BP8]MDR6711594.1 iron complex transport system permease protein [Pseudomonas hunanensis]HDS1733770.1 iron chelate uptake ABC transporter family permease subunit [Pseudomonas putida]